MSGPSPQDVTRLLRDWSRGDETALAALMPLVYDELHRLAERSMRQERPDHTLQPTALVHEAFLRLVGQKHADWRNRAQFLGVAARMMRRVLVDHARKRRYRKRGGDAVRIPFDEDLVPGDHPPEDLLALDEALERLAAADQRKGRVIELRVFAGCTIEETAAALGVSIGTVINDYRMARAWLCREIRPRPAAS